MILAVAPVIELRSDLSVEGTILDILSENRLRNLKTHIPGAFLVLGKAAKVSFQAFSKEQLLHKLIVVPTILSPHSTDQSGGVVSPSLG